MWEDRYTSLVVVSFATFDSVCVMHYHVTANCRYGTDEACHETGSKKEMYTGQNLQTSCFSLPSCVVYVVSCVLYFFFFFWGGERLRETAAL